MEEIVRIEPIEIAFASFKQNYYLFPTSSHWILRINSRRENLFQIESFLQ